MRRFGRPDDSWPTLVLATRSDIDLDRQVTAPGATWLDYRLVEHERMPLAMSAFGQEVRNAMEARTEHLAADGLARRQRPRTVPQRDLLATLRRRELDAAGAGLSAETAMPYTPAAGGEMVAGTFRQRLTPSSGRFAMIDNGLGFALVPWTPALGRYLGIMSPASPGAPARAGDLIAPLARKGVSPGNARRPARADVKRSRERPRAKYWGGVAFSCREGNISDRVLAWMGEPRTLGGLGEPGLSVLEYFQ